MGYESHNDYEVIRHGDDGASFKLKYPPVEKGAIKVKHYNPDFIPTIRKKMFWVIEAKSPKSVEYPFDYKYIVQGLQYCIHPEVQAKYLVLSNGVHTSVYDPQSSIFSEGDMYQPIFEFKSNEVFSKWDKIYEVLGVEKLRVRIEDYLKSQYQKLCLSSLDGNYPELLAYKITKDKHTLKQKIVKNVARLRVASMDDEYVEWQKELESESLEFLKVSMEYPLRRGKEPSQHYVERLLLDNSPDAVLYKLIQEYKQYSYFQKEHCLVSICYLHTIEKDGILRDNIKRLVLAKISEEISPLNKAESAFLRIIRKIIVIYAYPKLREKISKNLTTLPELERFVNKPSAQNYTYSNELVMHDRYFMHLKKMDNEELLQLTTLLLEFENELEGKFTEAKKYVPQGEQEINGLEWYGSGDKIYTLKNIAYHFNVITEDERENA